MVARKPLPGGNSIDPAAPPRLQDMRKELWSATDSDPGSDSVWEDAAQTKAENAEALEKGMLQDVPESLKPGGAKYTNPDDDDENVWEDARKTSIPLASEPVANLSEVPQSLRPGPGPSLGRAETNPFLRKKLSQTSSQGASGAPTPPTDPVSLPNTQSFSQLSIGESSNNPWQPAIDQRPPSTAPPPIPVAPSQDSERDPWAFEPAQQPPQPGSKSPALLSLASEGESPAWDEEPEQKSLKPPPPSKQVDAEILEDQHAWDDFGTQEGGRGKAAAPPPPLPQDGPIDDWNLIDHDPISGPPPGEPVTKSKQKAPDLLEGDFDGQAPALPPRHSADQAPRQPPRPVNPAKTETYQIKNINWYDINAATNPRTSPILVQNANGPCPLVALVNALTLTTPAELSDTALVQVLRSREQISLNLLLDAVFDELMSPRRTHQDASLPDVTELYDFLKGLHTGMNVNPRFIPTPEIIQAFKRTSLTHLHPTERGDVIPGTFEDTREMALYATFAIPLIHGWLPLSDDPVYEAFNRRAASYEDAQNLLFCEEELEEKLGHSSQVGLTEEEQQIYQDILTIKSFLSISATQLTAWGLEVITKAMKPGSVAILFRNDHFSTLYRHPQTLQLLTLVTDAGYASHDEIVWESLTDVNGEHAEFFSGDFRLVGGAIAQQAASLQGQQGHGQGQDWSSVGAVSGSQGGWTTVQGRGRQSHSDEVSSEHEPPLSPNHEQEDRDLALALQLQEEEEERHRNEQARRRRESMLSEQFIEQQGRQPPTPAARGGARGGRGGGGRGGATRGGSTPSLVSHRSSVSNGSVPVTTTGGRRLSAQRPPQEVRPLVPPTVPQRRAPVNRPADEGVDDAPPSYEQAQSASPYVPPRGHPSHPTSSPSVSRQNTNPGANSNPASRPPQGAAAGPSAVRPLIGGRRPLPPGGAVGNTAGGKDKDCVVM